MLLLESERCPTPATEDVYDSDDSWEDPYDSDGMDPYDYGDRWD